MPVAPTYPGVYVEELPSGVHTITGVSTSVTAFLGYFTQGPMNQAVRVFSVSDVERAFGALTTNSEAGYGLRQFFANGGSEAWVVRVASGTSTKAAINIADAAGALVLTATAASEGLWGNSLRISIDSNTTDPTATFNLTVTQVDASSPPRVLATEVYRNLTYLAGAPNNVVDVVNASSSLVQLTPTSPAPTTPPVPSGTVGGDIRTLDLTTLAGETLDPALGADSGSITIPTPAPASVAALAANLQQQLRALASPALPAATVNVIGSASTHQYLQVLAGTNTPSDILTFTGSASAPLGLETAARSNVQQYVLGSATAAGAQQLPGAGPAAIAGADGGAPDSAALIGDPNLKTGLSALDAVDTVNLLCLPDTMNLSDSGAFAAISAAQIYAQARNAFLLVDLPQRPDGTAGTPVRDSVTAVQTWLDSNASLRGTYSALYFPRPQIPDPINGFRLRATAASGTIAGLYARTDSTRGVWKAPAGTAATLTNVASLTYKATDAENGALNPLGINCLRTLPVYGNVCWGARTLDGADQIGSDWKYIPVRRTALFIESSLKQGTQWVVFEPNDEPLWSQIRLNVGSFMRGLFQQGAFQGSTPSTAYFVKCDAETTTQADINLGVVNILVGFAPLKPAEFVILQIQQIAGQIPT